MTMNDDEMDAVAARRKLLPHGCGIVRRRGPDGVERTMAVVRDRNVYVGGDDPAAVHVVIDMELRNGEEFAVFLTLDELRELTAELTDVVRRFARVPGASS